MKVFKLEKVTAHMKNGVNVKQNKNGVGDRLSRIETISDGNFNFDKVGFADLSSDQKSKYKINKNDILFSHINSLEHLGKTAIYEANQEIYHGVNLLLIRANDLVLPKYLRYFFIFLRNSGYWIKNGKQAINQASVNQTDIKNIHIPVPSLQEQEKIVERLDKVFDHISTKIENTKTQVDLNSLIFESYFENVQSNFMNSGSISEFFDLATGGTPSRKNKDYFNNGSIPWLVSGDIHQENIFESKNFITEDALKNSNAKYLPVGSVLIALNGQGKTRGTVAQLKISATCNQSLVSINSKDNSVIKNEFLFYYLKSQYKKIRKLTGDSGNDRRGLNMKIINSMLIKFPEISVQEKVIDNCKSLIEINKNLTQILENKINKYAKLKNSILNKEFSYE